MHPHFWGGLIVGLIVGYWLLPKVMGGMGGNK